MMETPVKIEDEYSVASLRCDHIRDQGHGIGKWTGIHHTAVCTCITRLPNKFKGEKLSDRTNG